MSNAKRMIVVWTVLVAAMGLAWLVGTAMMPGPEEDEAAAPSAAGQSQTFSELGALLWPQGMPPSRRWRYVVVHHSATESGTLESITRAHQDRRYEDAGYHFIINNGRSPGTADGEVTPTPRWYDQRPGAHAGVDGKPEFNREGIGICLVGHFDHEAPTEAQMAALGALVQVLRSRHGIPLERIVGHGELKATNCPGRLFPMETFLMDLRASSLKEELK